MIKLNLFVNNFDKRETSNTFVIQFKPQSVHNNGSVMYYV